MMWPQRIVYGLKGRRWLCQSRTEERGEMFLSECFSCRMDVKRRHGPQMLQPAILWTPRYPGAFEKSNVNGSRPSFKHNAQCNELFVTLLRNTTATTCLGERERE